MKKFTISMALTFVMAFAFQSSAQTVEFEDDFENGNANWVLTGAWGLTDAQSNSATHSMTDSPGGNYSPTQDTYCTMLNGVDLSDPGILSAEVSFFAIYDIETSTDFDWVRVLASDDDFATSAELGIFNGEGNLDPWIEYSYSLGAYIGSADVKVQFYFHSDGGYEVDGIYFDDFKVTSSDVDDAPPYVNYPSPPTFYYGTIDDYVIDLQLIDVSGIGSTSVNYQADGGSWESVDGVNTADNSYQYTIPAQEPGSMVVFTIEATDASPANNTVTTMEYKYIAGTHIYYDEPEVEFYTNLLAGSGAAVNFTIQSPTQLVTALIRNYADQSLPPNKDFMFHVWSGNDGGPVDDLITPFSVTPAASPENPNPMTVIDLRDYMDDLTIPEGLVFMGLTVPEDTVKITLAPLAANRSFVLNEGTWGSATGDFHFRLVTNGNYVGIDDLGGDAVPAAILFPNPSTDILYIDSKNVILNISVFNVAGQEVYNAVVNQNKTQIEVNSFDAGVYFVNVETVNGISTQKIIVK